MIVTKDFPNKVFPNKDDLFKALRDNKKQLKASKMLEVKHSDAINYSYSVSEDKISTTKETKEQQQDVNKITVKFVVNSCGIFDSHRDVHVKGCWNKTAKENKYFLHLKEHKSTFEDIISDDVKLSIEEVEIQGVKAECLVATSNIDKKDNPLMFDKYKNGKVKQHSVGMQYIMDKLYLCINSEHEEDKEEKENWDKYYEQVINKDELNEVGYFWAVAEAKAREGSAVPFGSNSETPTISVEENKNEPEQSTQTIIEPSNDTQKFVSIINNLKI